MMKARTPKQAILQRTVFLKFWTCVKCDEPSDYDFCPECEQAEIDHYEQAEIERKYYDEMDAQQQYPSQQQ